MKKLRILKLALMFLGIIKVIYSMDYYIVTNVEANIYIKPDIKSKKMDYKFESNELLSVSDQTNIGGKNWLYVNLIKNKKGWVLKENTYDIRILTNTYFYEIINREVLNNYKNINVLNKFIEIKFFDYPEQKYYGMQYLMKANDGWIYRSVLYNTSNNNLIRCLTASDIDVKFYFTNNYIIIVAKDGFDIYSTNQYERDWESGINPNKKKYKVIFSKLLLPRNQYKGYDSYVEYNETNGIMTEYLRTDPKKPFVVIRYKFKDGQFEKIDKRETNH